jgi:large subunit ribosomal protein L24
MKKFNGQSSKPTKMRKRMLTLRAHSSNTSLPRAALSTDLKARYSRNSVRVREGDNVKLVRGEYSGIEGKVQKVYASDGLVTVEGIHREKIAGGNTPVKIHTSNLVVTGLNLNDKWRREAIEGAQ